MSMTYANAETEARTEDTAFVPRYARNTKAKKSVKTWMILAPIGAVVLLGSGVAMMMGGEQAAPAQPAETAAPAMQTAPAAMTAAQAPVTPAPAEVWVMGGAQIYALALPLARRVVVTEIDQDFAGDAWAPTLGPEWREASREAHVAASGLPFAFVTYTRTA